MARGDAGPAARHDGLQEKSRPIETFFHKIVMLRNRLRTLEQQVNASDLPDDVKVKLQSYVSGCYGSLTSFNPGNSPMLSCSPPESSCGSGPCAPCCRATTRPRDCSPCSR